MSLLALNLCWAAIDVVLLLALVRGARRLVVVPLAVALAAGAFAVETGFSFASFHAMRGASFALFVHAPLLLVALGWRARTRRAAAASYVAAAALLVVAVDAFVYEPRALQTSSFALQAPVPLRVVVMSDIQAVRIGDYERGVFARMAALDPDLVLLAGDYVQVYGADHARVARDFRSAWLDAKIHPRLGTFAVRGDVERDGWEEELFGGTGVVTSNVSRTVRTGDVTITLLTLADSAKRSLALPGAGTGLNVVLGHRPDFSLGTGPEGLLVAGHTHGGQVQIPWWGPPMILSAVPRAWGAGGIHAVGDRRVLLVTRGAGLEHADDAPPLRFFCRPEIVELRLSPEPLAVASVDPP